MNTYQKYASVVQALSVVIIISNILITVMHWFFPLVYKVCTMLQEYVFHENMM